MAGLLKNQILKHLSKFAKNVSTNSINLSTFRGEGELYKLELNENVLNELLELPSWMKIVYAFVNRVSLKIQWTKLKSTPIVVSLDEVQVVIETVSDPKCQNLPQRTASYMSGGKYGFSDKVIDGITVTVNSVVVSLKSSIFEMSFHISRMLLCSKSPTWQVADLRMTRLKDPFQQHVLIFKELTWETIKIEAKPNNVNLMPVRLITNRSCCRITIKKKFLDCSVVGCRLVLFMDDILWVLTDSSLISAFEIAASLEDVIKKSTQESQKEKAARKLESIPSYTGCANAKPGDYSLSSQGYVPGKDESTLGVGPTGGGFWSSPSQSQINSKLQVFRKFDVIETSYHFFSDKIELHLCDDPGQGRSSYPSLKEGSSLQIEVSKMKIDFYPYHLALGDRTHWIRYPDGSLYKWIRNSLTQFKSKLFDSFGGNEVSHAPLERASPHPPDEGSLLPNNNASLTSVGKQPNNTGKSFAERQFRKLMSTCFIISCADLVVNFVTVCNRRATTHQIFSGDKKRKCFPPGTPFIRLELTHFFYPGGYSFPVPSPKLYIQAAPTILEPDIKSSLWANAFVGRLKTNAMAMKNATTPPYMDICIEALMPKIILRAFDIPENSLGSYVSMQVFVSRVYISNVRESDPASAGSRSSLFTCLEAAQSGELFFASGFPSKPRDLQPISSKFLKHALGSDNLKSSESIKSDFQPPYKLDSETLWTESRDIFFINLDPVWIDFVSDLPHKSDIRTFVHAFPLYLWLHVALSQPSVTLCGDDAKTPVQNSLSTGDDGRFKADVCVIAHTPNLVSAQVNRCQLVFLMRLLDSLTELGSFLAYDIARIKQSATETLLFAGIFPQVDVSLVLPVESSHSPSQSGAAQSQENVSIMSDTKPAFVEEVSQSAPLADDCNLSKSQSESCLPSVIVPDENESSPTISDAKSANAIDVRSTGNKERLMAIPSVKRGFNNLTGMSEAKSPDDMSDSMSINSDISNESDNFVMIFLNNDTASQSGFEHSAALFSNQGDPVTEIATEVMESPVIPASPDEMEKHAMDNQMVTVVTFSICKPQLIYETVEFDSTIKLQSNAIACEEVHLCRYGDFQKDFAKRNKMWSVQGMEANPCVFGVRLEAKGRLVAEQQLTSSQEVFRKCFEQDETSDRYTTMLPVIRDPFLEAEICNVSLSLYNSTAVALLALLDDEFVPLPLPFKASINNFAIRITEAKDTPFGQKEYSFAVKIPQMLANRDVEGNISLHHFSSSAEANSLQGSIVDEEVQEDNHRLRKEVEELRKKLNSSEEMNSQLRKVIQNNRKLESM